MQWVIGMAMTKNILEPLVRVKGLSQSVNLDSDNKFYFKQYKNNIAIDSLKCTYFKF